MEEIQETRTCETCCYFYRHYVRHYKNTYMPLDMGHCGNPRARDKKTDTPACHRWLKQK